MKAIENVLKSQGRYGLFALVLTIIAALGLTPSAVAQDLMHARVSFDSGGSMVKGTADEDWSYATVNTLIMPGDTLWVDEQGTLEVEMSGGTFLRMADESKADVVSLPPSGVIKGWTGAFYVQRISRSTGSFVFQTPVSDVHIERDAQVRFDILSNGTTTVSVRWGVATVRSPGAPDMVVRSGERCYIDPGYLPSAAEGFDRGEADDFDLWNQERARMLAVGTDAIPATVIQEAPIGASDLGTYGEWVTIDSDYYWRPTVVTDYVPYRYGRWSYVPACGYTWVGDYPFSYVTSHYGRWRHHPSYGWCWAYRDVWSPAWVATVRCGPNFMWSPLDPWDRPAVFGADYYSVGGLRFSIYASSYVPMDYVLYGSRYVYPFAPSIMYGVPANQINIWNININTHRPHFQYPDRSISVRDHAPRRAIRGPLAHDSRGTVARTRVASLESAAGRQRFSAVDTTQRRSVRTQVASDRRASQARSVRLTPEAASATPGVRGRTLATSDISGIRGRRRSVEAAPNASGDGVTMPDTSRGRDTTSVDRGRAVRGVDRTDSQDSPDASPRSDTETPRVRSRSEIAPDRSPRSAPDSPSVRSRGEIAPDLSPRSAPDSPSVRSRGEIAPDRSPRSAPDSPGVRIRSESAPDRSPRSAPDSPGVRNRSQAAPDASPRTVAPAPRTIRLSSPERSTVRVAPQTQARSRVIGSTVAPRAVESAPRAVEAPRAVAAPRASAPRQVAPAPQVRQAPAMPRVQSAPRAAPQMSAPSPRMSAPDRGSIGSSPSIGGNSRGGGSDRGIRSGGGDSGRSTRGRSR